jgi:hypothetical protein
MQSWHDSLATSRKATPGEQQPTMRCATCGCIINWEKLEPTSQSYVGVNARNFDPDALGAVRIQRLDGASTWKVVVD